MKIYCKVLLLIFYSVSGLTTVKAQTFEIRNNNKLKYNKEFKSNKELNFHLDSITNSGYFTLKLDSLTDKKNKKVAYLNFGKFYKEVDLKINKLDGLAFTNFPLKTKNPDSLIDQIKFKALDNGYYFTTIKANYLNSTTLDINVDLGKKRVIDRLVIEGETKLPEAYLAQLNKEYIGKTYNTEKVKQLSTTTQREIFVKEKKKPQTLFNIDSTAVYLYLEKEKSSSFDGILGFGNDSNNEFRISGDIELNLNNVFNSFETIFFNWRSSIDRSQKVNLRAKFPYWFKKTIGTETQLEIFRQDSTFVNLNLRQKVYYHWNRNQSLGLNLSYEFSNYLQEENFGTEFNTDFQKTGIGGYYEYEKYNLNRLLGREYYFKIATDFITSEIDERDQNSQIYLSLNAQKLFKLRDKNYLLLKLNGFSLESDADLVLNELSRIGGFGNLRGFNEASIFSSR